MDINTDVNTAQPSSAGDDYSFLSDDGSVVGVTETPPVSKQMDSQDLFADADNKPVPKEELKPVADVKPAEEASTDDMSHRAKKRVDKLNARLKESEEKITAAQIEAERYKKAFLMLEEQLKAKQSRLQEIDPTDPVVAENERLKFEKQIDEAQRELDKQYRSKLEEVQQQAKVQAKLDRIFEEIETVLGKYPTVSQAELAIAMKQSNDSSIEDLARGIHEQRYKALENEFMSKYKERLNAPKPVAQTGAATRRHLATDDELAEELDAMLGADWHRRHA